MITPRGAGVEFDVRVTPRARRTEHRGFQDGTLIVRLAAPPVEGAANEALVDYLAEVLGIPRRAVRIVSGGKSRHKRVAADGLTAEALQKRLL